MDDDDDEGTLVGVEVEDLIHCMQNALDKSDTCKWLWEINQG